jgi:hypothetical protein
MQDDDEILEAYERELDEPQPPRRKRGFPIVIGVLGLSCVFLLVEIFANRSIPNDIGTAQHDLRTAQAAAAQIHVETGSYAAADADRLNASTGDGIDYVGADEASQRLGQVSVFANGVTWAAAVQVRTGACFYLKLTAGETDPLYGVGTECTARQALTSKDDRW